MKNSFGGVIASIAVLILNQGVRAAEVKLGNSGYAQIAQSQNSEVKKTAGRTIILGLDADMSGSSAQSGEAIRRGAILAIDEINAAGGVLGRPLKLEVRDHRGNPARGVDNIEDFSQMKDVVAVIGGIHTPVAMAELKSVHKNKMIYLGPWAAGTPVVANGFKPNFVFRVSVRDQYAGGFLINAAEKRGFKRPGLLLWRNAWGRSNETAMKNALKNSTSKLAGIQWFNSGARDMAAQIDALQAAGADVVMLVANPGDGLVAVQSMANRPAAKRLPVISHWGITGGDFFGQGRAAIEKIDLTFLQTYSFYDPPFPEKSEKIYKAYCAKFSPCKSRTDITSPVGTAHAYDLVHILKRAISKAGTINRSAVRDALETVGQHNGLVRSYDPVFTRNRHDALDVSDFRMARYGKNGAIVPLKSK